jgi:hypothetical protein
MGRSIAASPTRTRGNRSAPTVLIDARGKIQGLLPGEDLSELRTALLERPHDLEVLVEEARRATSIQRDAPDQTHVRQQFPGHADDRLRAAEIDDGVVEREVDDRVVGEALLSGHLIAV